MEVFSGVWCKTESLWLILHQFIDPEGAASTLLHHLSHMSHTWRQILRRQIFSCIKVRVYSWRNAVESYITSGAMEEDMADGDQACQLLSCWLQVPVASVPSPLNGHPHKTCQNVPLSVMWHVFLSAVTLMVNGVLFGMHWKKKQCVLSKSVSWMINRTCSEWFSLKLLFTKQMILYKYCWRCRHLKSRTIRMARYKYCGFLTFSVYLQA